MAKERITTRIPIEPSHLNEYSPGSLQLPEVEDIWGENRTDWKASYLIWKNHGYTNQGNLIVGFLDLRQETGDDDRSTLSFYEKRVHQGGRENIIEGHVVTDATRLQLPLSWELKSSFVTPEGKVIPELNFHQEAVVEADRIIRTTNEKRFVEENTGKVMHEFGLLRYLFEPEIRMDQLGTFTFLENGLIPKTGHTIKEAPELDKSYEGKNFKCYVQFGYGINPIEYYIDDNNLLCTAISTFSAKIYNRDAAAFYDEFVTQSFNN